jgi:MraZ protein
MFVSNYPHRLNGKYQLTLPAKVREAIADLPHARSLNLIRSFAGPDMSIPVLAVLTPAALERKLSTMQEDPGLDVEFRRRWRASVVSAECDTQWRFVLPRDLREHLRIDRDVVFVGNGSVVELWNPKDWAAYMSGDQAAAFADAARAAARRYLQE